MGYCLHVAYGPCRASVGHDVAVPFFLCADVVVLNGVVSSVMMSLKLTTIERNKIFYTDSQLSFLFCPWQIVFRQTV